MTCRLVIMAHDSTWAQPPGLTNTNSAVAPGPSISCRQPICGLRRAHSRVRQAPQIGTQTYLEPTPELDLASNPGCPAYLLAMLSADPDIRVVNSWGW